VRNEPKVADEKNYGVVYMERALSGHELMRLLPGTKILTYESLTDYDDIEQLLGEKKQFVLLYLTTSKRSGHWTTVFVNETQPDTIQFYCSYASPIDGQQIFDGVSPQLMASSNQDYSYLSQLIIASRYPKITYNNLRCQLPSMATCGRHCWLRLVLKELDNVSYFKVITFSEFTPDELVTMLTENYLNHHVLLSPLAIMTKGCEKYL